MRGQLCFQQNKIKELLGTQEIRRQSPGEAGTANIYLGSLAYGPGVLSMYIVAEMKGVNRAVKGKEVERSEKGPKTDLRTCLYGVGVGDI